jgi:hypothetical protein
MSDFFSRLAERTLGAEPVVRSDLPPVIAAAPEKHSAAAPMLQDSGATNVSAGEEIGLRTFDRLSQPERASVIFKSNSEPEREQRRLWRRPTDSTISADEPQRARARASYAAPEISFSDDRVPERPAQVRNDPAGTQAASLFARYEPAIAPAAGQRDVPSEQRIVERSMAAPPSIHVSIGRIEVRAITPAPRASAPERRPATRLSLEQYLRERNEGRR